MSVRVLIADDERLVRAGLRMILERAEGIDIAGEAADGQQAVALAATLRPDVVLMDVRMPRLDGIEATRRMVADAPGPSPGVIVLTTFDLDEYVLEALRAGARGFLLKDAPESQLEAAILLVASGGSMFAARATRQLVEAFADRASGADIDVSSLTPRELEVLRLVAEGCSNREIATALHVSEHTAKTHVAHILDKLGLRDRIQAVIVAYETGIVRPGQRIARSSPASGAG